MRAALHLDDVQLASLGSVFLWSYALFSPFAGLLADRFSRSRVIVSSLAAWSLVSAATALVQTYPQLVATRILLGLSECFYLPAATALLAQHHSTETRGTAMSIHSVGLNFGMVLGGTAAGYMAERFGWRAGFLVLGIFGVLLAVAASFVLRDAPPSAASQPRARPAPLLAGLARLVRIPSYLILVAKVMIAGIGVWTFLNWLPLYYRETFHLNLGAAGFAGTFMLQAFTTLGIAAGGWWSDRLAVRATRNRMLLQSLSYFAAAPFLWIFLARPSFVLVSAAIALFSLLRGLGQSNENPVLCDVVEPRLRSTAIGFMNMGASLAGGIGVFAAGILKRDLGLDAIFAAVSFLFLLAGALLLACFRWLLPRDIRRREESELVLALPPGPPADMLKTPVPDRPKKTR